MHAARGWSSFVGRFLAILILLTGSAGLQSPVASATAQRVAYIYSSSSNTSAVATRDQFVAMLTGKGLTVDVYEETQAGAAATDLSVDDAVIIADDLGASGFIDSAAFDKIQNSTKPVVAIGQGGSVFFGLAGLSGVTSGGFYTGASATDIHAADPYAPIWSSPDQIPIPDQNKSLYLSPVSVYTYQATNTIQFVTRIGRLPGDPNHYSVIAQRVGSRCYSYWGYRAVPAVQSGVSLFYNLLEGSPCMQGTYSMRSATASPTPAMDGDYSYGEWPVTLSPNSNLLRMDHGFILATNDSYRLYLLLDVTEAGTNNPPPNLNDLMVSVDVNNDGLITPNQDKNFATQAGTFNLRYQTYNGPANWSLLSTTTKSSLGPGFNCFTTDSTKVLQIGPPASFSCAAHQIFEVAIDLSEIGALPGQTIHIGVRARSSNPNFTDELPNAFTVDFSNLITLQLASSSIPPHTPGATIAFATPPVEITQVIQNSANNIPLVAGKTTAGRVSVFETGSSQSQPAVYYLYGRRGVDDLPGSPLALVSSAPPAVDRGKLTDSANFLLPPSWITPGEVFFHAEARDFNGNNIASSEQLLVFQHKQTPTYWIVQENMAAPNALPDLMVQATIDSFASYTRAVFPVPDIHFVQKPWTVLGALNGMNLNNNVTAVQQYYALSSAVYWQAVNQNKVPPFALPDMIYGAANVGGGLSDPTWFNNGAGRAAAGGSATSLEGVIAHEFNHNLDRSSNGTWGRHVNACNASGPDPLWPYGSSFSIQEYGFDTRLPWQDTGMQKTVVPNNIPDLMSYCQSGILPTKWVSPYRYTSWFGSSMFPTHLAGTQLNAGPVPSAALYVSGSLSAPGTAGLMNPALLSPGIPIVPSTTGAYSISLLGPGGALLTHKFDISFTDPEGNPQSTVFFSFVLPDPGGVTGIQLKNGAAPLASISKSAAAPVVDFTSPNGDATLSGTQTVTWTLSDSDTPLANISLALQYSPNNGDTWIPVAAAIPGTATSFALDTNLLPKSINGKLRLLASDGLNNVIADSAGLLTVSNHPPQAHIAAPLDRGFIPANTPILLQGSADDVEDATLPGDNFLWSLDGSTTLGVGNSLLAALPNGVHTLTLTALDLDGASGSTSIRLFVQVYPVYLPAILR